MMRSFGIASCAMRAVPVDFHPSRSWRTTSTSVRVSTVGTLPQMHCAWRMRQRGQRPGAPVVVNDLTTVAAIVEGPMARGDFTFESRMVPLLLGYARERGVDVKALVKKYELPADVLAQPPGKAPVTTKVSVLPAISEDVAQALSDPHVGLALAAWSPRGAHGVVEFLARTGPTLRQAWANVLRFNAILGPDNSFHIDEVGDEARFTHVVTRAPGALGRHFDEYVSAIFARSQLEMSGRKPTRAWFVHAQPAQLDMKRVQQALHTGDVSFDAPDNGFAFEAAALELPVLGGDPALYAYLEEHALAALASRPRSDDLIEKLRHALREALKQGEPNVERLAKRLSLSGRTLQRRLTQLKTSFQEVLDHVRFDLARQYLRDARLDLTQIAYLLGYSELRAFDRAFRRWANKSPGDWRAAR